jgi:hypothetical protein
VEALGHHKSQLTEGIRFFEEFMLEEASRAGQRGGVDLAEGFRILDLS